MKDFIGRAITQFIATHQMIMYKIGGSEGVAVWSWLYELLGNMVKDKKVDEDE